MNGFSFELSVKHHGLNSIFHIFVRIWNHTTWRRMKMAYRRRHGVSATSPAETSAQRPFLYETNILASTQKLGWVLHPRHNWQRRSNGRCRSATLQRRGHAAAPQDVRKRSRTCSRSTAGIWCGVDGALRQRHGTTKVRIYLWMLWPVSYNNIKVLWSTCTS